MNINKNEPRTVQLTKVAVAALQKMREENGYNELVFCDGRENRAGLKAFIQVQARL